MVEIHTPTFRRLVRVDFNIVSTKLFLKALVSAPAARDMSEIVRDLGREAGLLLAQARALSEPKITLPSPTEFAVRLVSPVAAQAINALQLCDDANRHLVRAEFDGHVTHDKRLAMVKPAILAWWELKRFALDIELKSSAELANEMAIM